MKKFVGTGVALITPFKEDRSVDVEALKELVRFQKQNGINYIVVLGTTGEYATLTKEERELVKQTIVEENNAELPLVLGIGGNNTQAVCEQIKTENLEGFDAVIKALKSVLGNSQNAQKVQLYHCLFF